MVFFGGDRLPGFFVERLHDFVCGEVAWFLCIERLRDFSHSLTHLGRMIYFSGSFVFFFAERFCDFFLFEKLLYFFV